MVDAGTNAREPSRPRAAGRDAREGTGVDIWSAIVAEQRASTAAVGNLSTEAAADATSVASRLRSGRGAGLEATLVFVGPKGCGKSSLINVFLENPKPPKPTLAIEYAYGARMVGTSISKNVVHVWDVGGGALSAQLAEVPFTPELLATTSACIVVDLAWPGHVIDDCLFWLKVVLGRVHAALDELEGSGSEGAAAAAACRGRSAATYGTNHPDSGALIPAPIPLVIAATRYDTIVDAEVERQRVLSRALRYVAHKYGATLVYTASTEKSLTKNFRHVVNHHGFGKPPVRAMVTDAAHPVLVPAGADTFADIGSPPDLHGSSVATPDRSAGLSFAVGDRILTQWVRACHTVFPPQDRPNDDGLMDGRGSSADPDGLFGEDLVDAMRAEKDAELAQYVESAARKARRHNLFAGDDDGDDDNAGEGTSSQGRRGR